MLSFLFFVLFFLFFSFLFLVLLLLFLFSSAVIGFVVVVVVVVSRAHLKTFMRTNLRPILFSRTKTKNVFFHRKNAPVPAPSSRSRGCGRKGTDLPPASQRKSGTETDRREPLGAAVGKLRVAAAVAAVVVVAAGAVGAAAAAAASKPEKSLRKAMSTRGGVGQQALLARKGRFLPSPGLMCRCCRLLWTS